MDFEIGFGVLITGLTIVNISPYSALIYVLVAVSLPLANWEDFWMLSFVSLVFAFFFRVTNPRR